LPARKRALQNKWVYKLKEEYGGEKRYKARLVVKGFAQKKGIDFDDLFSPWGFGGRDLYVAATGI
jgi:hypothetical protein